MQLPRWRNVAAHTSIKNERIRAFIVHDLVINLVTFYISPYILEVLGVACPLAASALAYTIIAPPT